MTSPSPRTAVPRLLAIVDLASDATTRRAWIAGASAAAVPAVWSRDRHRPDALRLAALEDLVGAGLRTLSASRPDLCVAAGAAGVHLASDGISVADTRRILGPAAVVGRSTHTLDEIEAAAEEEADYVVFGPVWATPGKGPAQGLEALQRACGVGIPVLALGGIDTARLERVASAGAWGVAGIRCCADPHALKPLVEAVAGTFGGPPAGH